MPRRSARLAAPHSLWSCPLPPDLLASVLQCSALTRFGSFRHTSFSASASLALCNHAWKEAVQDWRKSLTSVACVDLSPSDAAMRMLGSCEQLSSLELVCMYGTPRTAAVSLTGWKALARGCRLLCEIDFHVLDVPEAAVADLVDHCPLRSVTIRHATDTIVRRLARAPDLECLSLVGNFSDSALTALGRSCTALRDLTLDSARVSSRGLAHLARRCTALTSLNVCAIPELSDEAFVAIAQHCGSLMSLNMSQGESPFEVAENMNITDISARALAGLGSTLTELSADGTAISTVGLMAIARACTRLTCLTILETDVTYGGLYAVICDGHLQSLEMLDMSRLVYYAEHHEDDEHPGGDKLLAALATNLTQLSVLNVGDLDCTDAALAALSSGMPHLKALELSGCEELTDATFSIVADGFPKLEIFTLWPAAEAMTPEACEALEARRPTLLVQAPNLQD
jgi:hypothetical protein